MHCDAVAGSDDLAQEWHAFQQCSERLRQRIADAQLLVRAIAAVATVDQVRVDTPHSEPPNAEWEAFPVSQFALVPGLHSLRSVWEEWKHGLGGMPPVAYMEQRTGSLEWARSTEQRQLALVRGKIVQEIEYHLDHGRELEEVLVVGAFLLDQLGNSMTRLASLIQRNMECRRATFFEDPDGQA